MGKPWRKKESAPVQDVADNYKWSSQCYTLKEILTNFKLPVVVQCREDTNAEHLQNFFFDLRQPLLLHSKRTSRKVFARCVRKGPGGTIKELWPELIIPEDYTGWFKISKGLEFSKPSPHQTIGSIANSGSEFFLCTTKFNALMLSENSDMDTDASESYMHPIMEGEILRKIGVQKLDPSVIPPLERSLNRVNTYLACIDENDFELFISVAQTGLFYEVSDGNCSASDNGVIQVTDLLDEMIKMPIYVRHILGDPPPISQFYSPCLKLVRLRDEETLMGSTLDTGENILPFEIQTNSPIKFEIALNTPMLQACSEYNEAIELCDDVAQNYVTDMKLAVTFKALPEEEDDEESQQTHVYSNQSFVPDSCEQLDSISNSQRTSTSIGRDSELGEVDAISEFNIEWDPNTTISCRNWCENMNGQKMPEPDLASSESVDLEQVQQLNSVLGVQFFDINNMINQSCFKGHVSDTPVSNNNTTVTRDIGNQYFNLPSEESTEVTPCIDKMKEISDVSINLTPKALKRRYSKELCSPLLKPASPFSITSSSTNLHSSTSTVVSRRSQIDLSDHFPSIHSSTSNVNGKSEEKMEHLQAFSPFNYTGDICTCSDSSSSSDRMNDKVNSNRSLDKSWKSWGNKYRVVTSKDLPKNNPYNKSAQKSHEKCFISDDEKAFGEPSKVSSIITSKVTDEMVLSCNDLRLSLDEITRNARDNHIENTWMEFCLERSGSLPVRSKQTTEKLSAHSDEHSQSWEKINQRRKVDSSEFDTPRQMHAGVKATLYNNRFNRLDHNESIGDKSKLISDTSSEESLQYSHRSLDLDEKCFDNSFTLSEASDMSVSDGQASLMDAITEMDMYLNSINLNNSAASNNNTFTRDTRAIAQKMKIQQEIKKKQNPIWNDIVEVI